MFCLITQLSFWYWYLMAFSQNSSKIICWDWILFSLWFSDFLAIPTKLLIGPIRPEKRKICSKNYTTQTMYHLTLCTSIFFATKIGKMTFQTKIVTKLFFFFHFCRSGYGNFFTNSNAPKIKLSVLFKKEKIYH